MGRRLPCPLAWLLSCGNFRFRASLNGSRPGCLSSFPSTDELREVCYQVNAPGRLPEMTNELHASARYYDAVSFVMKKDQMCDLHSCSGCPRPVADGSCGQQARTP